MPFKTSQNDLLNHFNTIYQVLHLLYEDLKLNKLRDDVESPVLARFLLKLAVSMDPYRKAAFIDYYIKEHSGTLCKEEIELEIKKAFKDGHAFKEGVDVEHVPQLFKWLEECLRG